MPSRGPGEHSSPGWHRPPALPAHACNLQPSVHLVPQLRLFFTLCLPQQERESLAMRIQQVLNQCQTNEGGREASSQAHLHLCRQEGCGVTGAGDGEFRVYQGHRGELSEGLLEVGGPRGQQGTLVGPPSMPGLPGEANLTQVLLGLPGWAQVLPGAATGPTLPWLR